MVELVHRTENAEKLIAEMARVSSANPTNPEYEKLIRYLIKEKHWSPMEMVTLCLRVTTTRAIAAQILRHKSFYFQEFSQRYAKTNSFQKVKARRQDTKNRQNSIDDLSLSDKIWFSEAQDKVWELSKELYEEGLQKGIAKEQMRFLLPLNTETTLYVHGTLRSWIHYISLREANGTQLEHREIALQAKEIFRKEFPTIAKALDWAGETNEQKTS